MRVYRVKKATDIQWLRLAAVSLLLYCAWLRLVALKCRRAAALIAKPPITDLQPSLELPNPASMAFNQLTTDQI